MAAAGYLGPGLVSSLPSFSARRESENFDYAAARFTSHADYIIASSPLSRLARMMSRSLVRSFGDPLFVAFMEGAMYRYAGKYVG